MPTFAAGLYDGAAESSGENEGSSSDGPLDALGFDGLSNSVENIGPLRQRFRQAAPPEARERYDIPEPDGSDPYDSSDADESLMGLPQFDNSTLLLLVGVALLAVVMLR